MLYNFRVADQIVQYIDIMKGDGSKRRLRSIWTIKICYKTFGVIFIHVLIVNGSQLPRLYCEFNTRYDTSDAVVLIKHKVSFDYGILSL